MQRRKNALAGQVIHKSVFHHILKWLYPPTCVCCDVILSQDEDGCCPRCAKSLPWITEPACMKCGKPIADARQEYCDDCQKYRHAFDEGAAAFTYTGELRRSVYRMKAQNRRDYLDFYAAAMVHASSKHLPRWRPEAIIPIPMHPKKRRRRGYNQSELLAKRISALTGIPLRENLLRCVKLTASQKMLNRSERRKNLGGSIAAAAHFPKLHRVLLIDDIYTTGSTMDEMAGVLKRAGVEYVFFLVLCSGKGKKTVFTCEDL